MLSASSQIQETKDKEIFIKDHKFTKVTPLPTKEAALGSTKNKTQLIELVSRGLLTAANVSAN